MWALYWCNGRLLNIFLFFAVFKVLHGLDITCPDDITQYAIVGLTSTPVTWSEPITSDDTVSVISTHDPGHVFFIGSSTVFYVAQDGAGNSVPCTFTVTVIRDDIPIVSNCPSDQTLTSDPGTASTTATWTDPTFSDETGMLVPTASHSSGDSFQLGATQVTYEATDVTNNTLVCMFTITVEDNEDPTFTDCPSSASGKALAGTTTSVSWSPPTANDNSGIAVTMTTTHNPGDNFAIGDTGVIYTAVDAAGNSAMCSLTVTVQETTGPEWSNCPPAQSVDTDVGEAFATVTWTVPTASDVDDVPTVTLSHNPGDSFVIGVTVVTYIATDGDGFSASCSFAIVVADSEDPVISNCPSDITTNALTSKIPVSLSWTEPTASDNTDKSDLLVASHNPGDALPSGETQVTYVATDDAGNQAMCSFTITVQAVDPADIISYNGTLGLDRISSVNGPFQRTNGLLSQSLMQELDIVLRTSSIGANFVGFDDMTVSLNNNGVAVLEYTLHVTQDSGYSTEVIEESFEENLMGTDGNEFLNGNRVVGSSFVIGICFENFCQNGGQCILDKEAFVSRCSCPSAYTGSQCQSKVSLSLTLIIVISVTSGIFLVVLILLLICCFLTCGNNESKAGPADHQDKFPLTEAEKARGVRNPIQPVFMAKGRNAGIQNGGFKDIISDDGVFYPNGIPNNSPTPVQNYPNGNIPVTRTPVQANGSVYVPLNPGLNYSQGSKYYLQPMPISSHPNGSAYVKPNPAPSFPNGVVYVPPKSVPNYPNERTYNVPPNPVPDDYSGPRFKHRPLPTILLNGSQINDNFGKFVEERLRAVPLRRTRSHSARHDSGDSRRRRRRHRKHRRTRSLGHRFVYSAPPQSAPIYGRPRRRTRQTASLRLPGERRRQRVPDRDYTLPREFPSQFLQLEQTMSAMPPDISRYRTREPEHLNLETRRFTHENPYRRRSQVPVSTGLPLDYDIPPPPSYRPPPPPPPPTI